MKRTGFARKAIERRPLPAPSPVRQVAPTVISGIGAENPKFAYVRSKALREAYRLIPCQYDRDDGLCGVAGETVCCNHSNWAIHGKGKSIKASDVYGASGCLFHHAMLDQGKWWTDAEKKAYWWRAHQRSVRLLVALGLWPEGIAVPDVEHCPF